MPPNTSILAHRDVKIALDRALQNTKGVRVKCTSRGEAYSLRQRFYTFRKADRRSNGAVYPPEHPLHFRSVYDQVLLVLGSNGEGAWYVDIVVSNEKRLEERIEDLGPPIEEVEEVEIVEPDPAEDISL
jgi:hypothetical protein